MPSTFLGLNTGTSGLNYFQAALNTTAHNISNASTKGYSRQQVLSEASGAIRLNNSAGMQGTGVSVLGIEQIRNSYYDTKYWNNATARSEYQAKYDGLYEIENYFNEMKSPTGYTAVLDTFAQTVEELIKNPSGATVRTSYVNAASNYTKLFQELSQNLQTSQRSLNDELALGVVEVNSIAKQIYSLNEQISNMEVRGGNAGDLRDKRANLVDQLSEYVNVDVTETPMKASDGTESKACNYVVRINGQVLVDEMNCYQLMVVPRTRPVNTTDVDGLYDVYWTAGNGKPTEQFNMSSYSLSGKLKGIVAARDGNDNHGFDARLSSCGTGADGTTATVRTAKNFTMEDLNIPTEGTVSINNRTYYYDSFEATYDETGTITEYTFKGLQYLDENAIRQDANPTEVQDGNGKVKIGENVDFRGIPYYMTQMNSFLRTFSKYINEACESGVDAKGDPGVDMFTTLTTDGKNMNLAGSYNPAGGTFTSEDAGYYRLNALNWIVNTEVLQDHDKIVVSYESDISQNDVEAHGVLDIIKEVFRDTDIFTQGTPAQFLESMTATLAVDTYQSKTFTKHHDDVVAIVDNQRISVAGVDTNEEAANLVVLQNGYNLACKVITVMNEIYDKLINQMGV